MLASYLLSLREGIEATLVIGIVFGVLRKIGRSDCRRAVWLAVASAVVTSLAAAIALHAFGWSLSGSAEPVFEGFTLFIAAGLLTWMIFWMARQSGGLKAGIESDVQRVLSISSHRGLFALIFIAVAREGLELAVFLTASAFHAAAFPTLVSAVLGLGTAAFLGWLLFAGAVRLDLQRFFQVTNLLLLVFGAGLVAKGVHEFNEVGWIPAIIDPLWNTSSILDEHTPWGRFFKTLFGYRSEPSLTVVLAYAGYVIAVVAVWTFARRPEKSEVAQAHPVATHPNAASGR